MPSQALFAGRALPFDEKAGLVSARLMAAGTAKGRPGNPLDMIVAAVAEANDCVVVTENERDLAGRINIESALWQVIDGDQFKEPR